MSLLTSSVNANPRLAIEPSLFGLLDIYGYKEIPWDMKVYSRHLFISFLCVSIPLPLPPSRALSLCFCLSVSVRVPLSLSIHLPSFSVSISLRLYRFLYPCVKSMLLLLFVLIALFCHTSSCSLRLIQSGESPARVSLRSFSTVTSIVSRNDKEHRARTA